MRLVGREGPRRSCCLGRGAVMGGAMGPCGGARSPRREPHPRSPQEDGVLGQSGRARRWWRRWEAMGRTKRGGEGSGAAKIGHA